MLEAEVAFCDDLNILLKITEEFLRFCIFNLLSDPVMMDDFDSLGQFSAKDHMFVLGSIMDAPRFPRLPYADAVKLLTDNNQKLTRRGVRAKTVLHVAVSRRKIGSQHFIENYRNFLRFCIFNLLSDPVKMDDFDSLGQFSAKDHMFILGSIMDTPPFPRLPYADAVKLLTDNNQITGRGLTKQNEAFLVDYHKSPVFVTHFPSEQKPFYMLRSPDGKLTESFDLLCPGVCELAGGSIREPSAEIMRERNPSVKWYAEIRERGKPISGGFGLGFERLLQLLLGVPNIKNTNPFPRKTQYIEPIHNMVKFKSRYILLEMENFSGNKLSLTRAALFTTIAETVGDFHGDRGFAWVRTGLVVKVIDGDIALVRVESSSEKFVTSVIPFITNINGTELFLRTLFIGRSIRACEKFLIKYRRKELYGLLRTAETGVEKNAILKAVNSVTGKLE
ncbi:unnamed protein product [Cylicocyclus nassatus]|uniref:Aminoacyl-transfer RNA synthetases class-II family profile domain-containing protein n=1 Tax=Cylicocyclus nassatus TaxID=53992 RepID=A0AA36GVV2_CYLNA|nr:unnamed protein product [Cylicocyclus nassatus]